MSKQPDNKVLMELFSELCTAVITFKAVPQRTLSVCLPKIFPRGILEDRRDELIRFNIKGTNQNVYNGKSWFCKDAVLDPNDRHCDLFPIPKSAMDGNPKLKQNPGYASSTTK